MFKPLVLLWCLLLVVNCQPTNDQLKPPSDQLFNYNLFRRDVRNFLETNIDTVFQSNSDLGRVMPYTEVKFSATLGTTGTIQIRELEMNRMLVGLTTNYYYTRGPTFNRGHQVTRVEVSKFNLRFDFNGNVRYMGINSFQQFRGEVQDIECQLTIDYNESNRQMSLTGSQTDCSIESVRVEVANENSSKLANIFRNYAANRAAEELKYKIAVVYDAVINEKLTSEVNSWSSNYTTLLTKYNYGSEYFKSN